MSVHHCLAVPFSHGHLPSSTIWSVTHPLHPCKFAFPTTHCALNYESAWSVFFLLIEIHILPFFLVSLWEHCQTRVSFLLLSTLLCVHGICPLLSWRTLPTQLGMFSTFLAARWLTHFNSCCTVFASMIHAQHMRRQWTSLSLSNWHRLSLPRPFGLTLQIRFSKIIFLRNNQYHLDVVGARIFQIHQPTFWRHYRVVSGHCICKSVNCISTKSVGFLSVFPSNLFDRTNLQFIVMPPSFFPLQQHFSHVRNNS